MGGGERPHMDTSLNTSMYDTNIINFFDVYSVGEKGDAIPFEKGISLVGIIGELVALKATFDDCAMVNVIDKWHLSTSGYPSCQAISPNILV